MTGNQLKDYIDMFQLGNYQVVVGCKGKMNALEVENKQQKTHVEMMDGKIFIHDESHFTEERLNYYKTKEEVTMKSNVETDNEVMKVFSIPVEWVMTQNLEVKATSLEEAVELIHTCKDEIPLGDDAAYVGDTWRITADEDYDQDTEKICENLRNYGYEVREATEAERLHLVYKYKGE